METKTIIQQRHQQYGSYELQAGVAQLIKCAIFETVPLDRRPTLSQPQIESLQMIATKISRIVCGNPNNVDSWRDISGYSALIADILEKDQAQ